MTNKIPIFKSAEEEAAYWETHAITDHLDELQVVDEKLTVTAPRRRKNPINLRIDEDTLLAIKDIAETTRIPYQTLIQSWLVEKLRKEYPEVLKRYTQCHLGPSRRGF